MLGIKCKCQAEFSQQALGDQLFAALWNTTKILHLQWILWKYKSLMKGYNSPVSSYSSPSLLNLYILLNFRLVIPRISFSSHCLSIYWFYFISNSVSVLAISKTSVWFTYSVWYTVYDIHTCTCTYTCVCSAYVSIQCMKNNLFVVCAIDWFLIYTKFSWMWQLISYCPWH